MSDLNTVCITGRLGRDPEVKYTSSNKSVCNISLAVDDSYQGATGERVDRAVWIDVTLWGATADIAGRYLSKGSRCAISGRLSVDEWQDAEGNKRSKVKVTADRLVLLEKRGDAPAKAADHAPPAPHVEEKDVPF